MCVLILLLFACKHLINCDFAESCLLRHLCQIIKMAVLAVLALLGLLAIPAEGLLKFQSR